MQKFSALVLILCLSGCEPTGQALLIHAAIEHNQGIDGINCWDLNENRIADDDEDINDDGEVNVLDCRGEDGTNGIDGLDGVDGAPGTNGVDGQSGGGHQPPGNPGQSTGPR